MGFNAVYSLSPDKGKSGLNYFLKQTLRCIHLYPGQKGQPSQLTVI